MSNKDLINLGISPDSGTGDSARRGGEKINTLFADVYSQFGDNPVGQDPSQPFYGYRQPFFEYEYKVGELHPAGRFIPIEFKTPAVELAYDSEWGWGYNNTGTAIDTDGDGIPDIYRDSEWYFLSRGERIDADLSQVDSERKVHFVLPLAVPGDQVVIRDGYSTWKNNRFINIWTTPYEFSTVRQVEEWQQNTGYTDGLGYPDSDTLNCFSPTDGTSFRSNWHKVKPSAAVEAGFPRLSQPFALSRTTDPYQGLSPTYFQNITRYQLEFLFTSYEDGWLMRLVVLDAADISATIAQLSNRMDAVDSDLERGLYVSADSDIRHTVPLLRRTADGREIHGNLSLRGDGDSIMTTIDSEDTSLINDPRSANGGDAVQPLTTTIRFKLRDNVKVKEDLLVGSDLTVGNTLNVRESFSVDSDAVVVNDTFKILDSDGAQRFVFEKARQGQFPDGVKGSGADLNNPNERPTVEPDYALHVKSNAVFGRDSDDVVVFNSRIMSNLIPFGDERYNLGDSDNKWKDLYLAGNTIYLGSIKLKDEGGVLFIADSDDNRIDLTGADFTTDNLTVDSDVVIGGNSAMLGQLRVQGHAQFDSDVGITGNLVVRDHATLGGRVLIQEGLTVDSDTFLGADLHVDSDVIIKGTMSVGQEAHFHDDVTFHDSAWFDSDVIITGSLTVNGTTTYVNSTNLEVKDNFIVINKNQASPFNDTGIIFQRFDSDSVSATNFNSVFEWDETAGKFIIGETDGSGITPNPGITASYAQFYSNGNVQFFEDTGATAKFHWDATNERLGLGTVAPITTFEIDNGTDDKYIQLIQGSNGKYIAFGVENDTAYVTAGTAGAASARELAFQVAPASGVEYEVGRFNSAGSWLIGGDTVASAKFAFDMSGNSDPGGEPAGGATNRPTLTGDGVIDGGTF